MKSKRGQEVFGMSFGMMFVIFLIIVTVAVSFYVIGHFLNINKCAQVGSFYDTLNDEIDSAWRASITRKTFEGSLPSEGFFTSGIEKVCFGDPTQSNIDEAEEVEIFKRNDNQNIFLYPPEKACDGELATTALKNVEIGDFFCVDVIDGFARVRLEKGSRDLKVRIGNV